MADQQRPFQDVLIVGAGPAGLLLALLLAQHGIPVTILEMSHQLDQQPRAAHYGPPAVPDLARAGLLAELRAKGMSLSTMCWRQLDETYSVIAGWDGGILADVVDDDDGGKEWEGEGKGRTHHDYRTVCYPLQDLLKLMLGMFVDKYGGEVRWRHKVVGVGQDERTAWVEVEVETPGETPGEGTATTERKRIEASYVVGCDGANSAVRKALFGNEFPGFTWDAQIIATNVSAQVIRNHKPPFAQAPARELWNY